jgi:glutamine synthetase
VDGSSLFPYIDPGASDLYVIPRFKTAYVNPFAAHPTVDVLCSFYTRDGTPLPIASENILRKAQEALKQSTGLTMEAMGELEYYVVYDRQTLYPTTPQHGYHESSPFSKWEALRCDAMRMIAGVGGKVKYGHTEVGSISGNGKEMEQDEIEFLPAPIEDAADQITVAKWILRMVGYQRGVAITFAPKIVVGHAGSGLHIHTKLVKGHESAMVEDGALSDSARKAIAGYLQLAPSLTAFGNTIPVSYLRLVPHQEAPTNICWGDRNRSVLVRVPLGWLNVRDMVGDANPQDEEAHANSSNGQTIEFRCSDGSANIYLLLAGLAVAARHGLETADSLETARKLYVDVNIFSPEHHDVQERLPQLPASCWESADCLLRDREVYEAQGVFPPEVIAGVAEKLKAYNDRDLSERLYGKEDELRSLVEEYLYC